MSLPSITVVIPTYNDARTLPRTVLSVLDQDLPASEVLIINDAGADPLPYLGDMASRVRVLQQPQNLGASAARNAGLTAASGDFIYFLDSDDIASPDFLRLTSGALTAHPDAAFAIGDGLRWPDDRMSEAEAQLPQERPNVAVEVLDQPNLFNHVASHPGHYLLSLTLWRRDKLARAISGEWLDSRLATDEDFQMFLRTALRHGGVQIKAIMGIHRLRPDSLSKNAKRVWTNRTRAMDLLLAEDETLAHQPEARRRILALRGNGARRVARILLAEGRRAEVRTILREDMRRAESMAARAKSALLWLKALV